MNGSRNFHAGRVAEERVADSYRRSGHQVAASRWRGKSGEIDLILSSPEGLVFVEVKKSTSFARAAENLGARQIRRLFNAAQEFLGVRGFTLDTPMRFDVALVDGAGNIDILPNALCA
ncbi:YraN family protein [Halodurantibacterium flavum]|uniref:UPF0102 protein ACFSGJ_16835 n=1 Tax=Halodurantibacterium flavum TaxID=1382802 RepID=A0ABW4SB88_9RHOB